MIFQCKVVQVSSFEFYSRHDEKKYALLFFIISDLIIYKSIKERLITMKFDSWSDT